MFSTVDSAIPVELSNAGSEPFLDNDSRTVFEPKLNVGVNSEGFSAGITTVDSAILAQLEGIAKKRQSSSKPYSD